MNLRLLSSLLNSAWLIDPRFALTHLYIVENILSRKLEIEGAKTDDEPKPVLEVMAASGRKKVNTWKDAEPGSIAIIPVMGPLEKYDVNDCGLMSYGMNTIAQWIKDAYDSPNIDAIVLNMDTPGGTADGTQNLSDTVRDSGKPIVTFVDGLMASAGIWIGSGSSHIIAQNSTTEIGSIGVMLSFLDPTGYYESKGFKIHYITADQSVDKNLDYLEALKGNYELIKKEGMNPLAAEFIASVKANRAGKIPEKAPVFSGKVFFAADALKYGLIDGIGSFDSAIAKARELADERKKSTSQRKSHKTNSIDMKKLVTLLALLGLTELEESDDGVFLNAEQLQTIEDRLLAADQAEADRDTARNELQTANGTIAERDSTIATLTKKPGSETSKVIKSNDKHGEKDELVDFCATHSTAEAIAKLREEGF